LRVRRSPLLSACPSILPPERELPTQREPGQARSNSRVFTTTKIDTEPVPGSLARNLQLKKIPSLDGLRAVAVILVMLNHLRVPYAPEGRGVLTFFVLSGFLITWLLLKESEQQGGISIKDFYVRRVLRIFPAFYVFWIIYFGLLLLMNHRPSKEEVLDCVSALFYVRNYRSALSWGTHMNHTWALSLEEQFYLLWPLLFAAFQRDLRKLTRVLIAVIAAVDIYRMVLFFRFHAPERWLNLAFDCRIDHLLVGCLLAVLLKRGVLRRFWEFVTSRVWFSLVPFGLILISIALNFRYRFPYHIAIGFVVDPLLTAVLIVQVIAFGNTVLWGWLNSRVVRYIGQVSYSMYLYHVLANGVVSRLLGRQPTLVGVLAAIGLTTLLGSVSYYLVETKFLRLKSRFTHVRIAKPPIAQTYEPAAGQINSGAMQGVQLAFTKE
jgi:peptidoglycan/LPS O-acetylase OafA/YrhL